MQETLVSTRRWTLDQNLERSVFTIVRARLEIEAPALPGERFAEVMEQAHAICPVSKLLVGGVSDVSVGRAGD